VGINLSETSPLVSNPWTNLHVNGPNVSSPVDSRTSGTPPSNLHVSSNGYGIDQGGSISFGSQPDNVNSYASYASIAGRRNSALGYVYSGYLQFSTSGGATLNERMRLTSDGRLNIAATGNLQSSIVSVNGGNYGVANCFAARVANTAYWNYVGIAPNNAVNFVVYGGGVIENSTGTVGTYSDIKLKENIVDAGSQWDDFKSVRFRKFNFKEETGFETHTQLGVIAQELELTSPNLVIERKDLDSEMNETGTTTKSVKTSILTMKAIVALQEAMARIETLESEVAALKGS
jgi:hypothetical protein